VDEVSAGEIPGFLKTDIDDETLAKMAKAIVRCMNMREGEAVWIRAGLHAWRLVEHIRYELLMNGVTSLATLSSDWFIERATPMCPKSTSPSRPRMPRP